MPADQGDILREQLEYLLEHERECGRPLCPECGRLRRVRQALLEPWRPVKQPTEADPADAAHARRIAEKWRLCSGRIAGSGVL